MKRNTQLFDLYWEDILVAKILPYLSLRDCYNFRCVSNTCKEIINMYFTKLKSLKLINARFSRHTFRVLTLTCNSLTVLNLSRCACLRDDDLIPILLINRNLVTLNLSQCENLSAKCLQPAILYCDKLRTLKMARCRWLTSGAMEALALHQCRLEDVDLSYCSTISENCILIFVKKFHNLTILNLEGNKQISDKCLYSLANYSKSLKLLNLSGCTEITDKGIRTLALRSQTLEGLLVRGCMKVTEQSLKLMRNRVCLDRRPTDPVPVPLYVQTSGLNRSSLGLVSLYAISPVPEKRRKVSSRGRKAAVAAVITSSPYKNDLENKNMKRQEKESKLVKTKNKKKTAKRNKQAKKSKDDSEEDSEELDVIQFDEGSEHDDDGDLMDQVPPDPADAECMFCSRLFSMDKSGESWIKCLMCGLWAHYDCAGPEFDTWICDCCK